MKRSFRSHAAGGFLVLAGLCAGCNSSGSGPAEEIALDEVTARSADLRAQAARLQAAIPGTVEQYKPPADARIDDLRADVTDILRLLPGVAGVKAEPIEKPKSRIIQLKDWNFLTQEAYVAERLGESGGSASAEESAALYEKFLLEGELVQLEQVALLRCLIQHHGLKRIFAEEPAKEHAAQYQEKIASLRRLETELPEIQEQQRVIGQTIQRIQDAGGDASEQSAQQLETQAQIDDVIQGRRLDLLRIGAAGRLLVAGDIDEVHPLDDGSVETDDTQIEAREDAQVGTVLKQGSFGFIILAEDHDLTDNIQRIAGGECDYVRITTKRGKEFAQEGSR